MLCEISEDPIERKGTGAVWAQREKPLLWLFAHFCFCRPRHTSSAMTWPFPGSLGWASLSHLLFSKLAYIYYQIDCGSSESGIVVMPGSYTAVRPRMASYLGSGSLWALAFLLWEESERNPEFSFPGEQPVHRGPLLPTPQELLFQRHGSTKLIHFRDKYLTVGIH